MSNSQPKIAVLRPLPLAAIQALESMGQVIGADCTEPLTGGAAAAILKQADAAFITGIDPFGEELFTNAPNLRFVSSVGVGTDHIDLKACEKRGITVKNTPDAPTEATADLVFALILASARRVVEGDRFMRDGQWQTGTNIAMGIDVNRKTIGIIGYGRIGAAVARRAQGFGMTVLFTARTTKAVDAGSNIRQAPFAEVLEQADFLVLQTPHTPETHHMIDAPELARMKASAILINASRGGVVSDKALAEALKSGTIAGAGMDVFEVEPTVIPELFSAPNLVMTPHIGSATGESREGMFRAAVGNLTTMLVEF